MNYLKKIRKGKYALGHNGTVDELRRALGICWSNDKTAKGNLPFYRKRRTKNEWEGIFKSDLPTIKVTDFLEWHDRKQVFTIKDLSNGKCAVINDGTLEELNQVLKAAFPSDIKSSGLSKFYERIDDLSKWTYIHKTTLPTQSVKEFIKELRLKQFADKVNNDLVDIQNPIKKVLLKTIDEFNIITEAMKATLEEKKLNQTKKDMKPLEITLEQASEIFKDDGTPFMEAMKLHFGGELLKL